MKKGAVGPYLFIPFIYYLVPHLGLHSAAANGNIGLVKYALSHNQPINSVLDGVLPLHVASSGGNELAAKLLIEQGADVNASRLLCPAASPLYPDPPLAIFKTPPRYSDQHGDTIVRSSGSTPLHFAAASGHMDVVRTLFLHGVTSEMLARDNGMDEAAEMLWKWGGLLEEGELDLSQSKIRK